MTRRIRRTRKIRSKRPLYIGGKGDSKYVFVELGGGTGLGNQLWIYAAGVATSIRSGLPLRLIAGHSNPHSKTDYRSIFTLGDPVETVNVKPRMNAARPVYGNTNGKNPHNNFSGKNVPSNKSTNLKMVHVFYQNYKSVLPALPSIRQDISNRFKEKYPDLEKTLSDPNTTLFMHVRRGDYGPLSPPDSYFQKALDIVNGSDKIKTVYIISDDIPYCKERFNNKVWNTTKELRYFEEPDEIKTLYFMSLCKAGAITSNSTFSSWGAILGADEKPGTTIIYPKGWSTGDSSRIQFPDPIGNKWIQL